MGLASHLSVFVPRLTHREPCLLTPLGAVVDRIALDHGSRSDIRFPQFAAEIMLEARHQRIRTDCACISPRPEKIKPIGSPRLRSVGLTKPVWRRRHLSSFSPVPSAA